MLNFLNEIYAKIQGIFKIKVKIQAFAKKREFVDCHDLTSSNLAMTAWWALPLTTNFQKL